MESVDVRGRLYPDDHSEGMAMGDKWKWQGEALLVAKVVGFILPTTLEQLVLSKKCSRIKCLGNAELNKYPHFMENCKRGRAMQKFQTDFAKGPFSDETFHSPKNIILRFKLWQYCGKCWPLEMFMGLRVQRPGLWFWSDKSNLPLWASLSSPKWET